MSSFKTRYDKKVKKEALGMIKSLAQKIQKGEFEVTSHGFWQAGTYDSYIFRVDVKENEKSEESDE